MERIEVAGLAVGTELHEVIVDHALPGTGLAVEDFFQALAALIAEFGPRNRELLEVRESMQAAIDAWHRERSGQPHDAAAYRTFLEELGYLVPEGPAFEIDTANVDPEIRSIPAPQLVVPVTNARYVLNAANARWGSLYDALYGTDALGDLPEPGPYSSDRGARVIAWARNFLDETVPLASGSHADATAYRVADGELVVELGAETTGLAQPALFDGYSGAPEAPTNILLDHNGLGIDIVIDATHNVGAEDKAGVAGHRRLRGLGRRCRQRREGPGLPQLARTHDRQSQRVGDEGRPHLHPFAQPRPHVHGSRRKRTRSHGPFTAAHPKRRTPDDDAGCARR